MLAAVVFVPSAPLLVPELAGPAASDTEPVRRAALDAVAGALGIDRWVAIGTADEATAGLVGEPLRGTFARFGVDVPVTIDSSFTDPLRRMSLSALIAGWIAERMSLGPLSVCSVGSATPPAECVAVGTRLAARLDEGSDAVGVLVVGDGSTALTDKAPGGGRRESAVALNDTIVAALGSADTDTLVALDPAKCDAEGVGGRVAWQVAAGLVGDRSVRAVPDFADAPFGVGYVVATWTVDDGEHA
ncbi:hypothetical protein O4159_02380 [Gordonia terrae]|uniref:hypothetical protein n=1 Tax=Gordonia hongkongensis TaxID=1701090 RepID=UPI0022B3F01E|nr:hypothetical protein [Gordonia terrae]